MKVKSMIMAVLFVFLTGCSASQQDMKSMDDEFQPLSTNPPANSVEELDAGKKEKVVHAKKALPFQTFELEVDYVDTLSYEVFYETSESRTLAVIEEIGKERIVGEKALDQLTPLFMELSFDENSSEQEVIDDIIGVFGLDETYKEFKLKVIFKNGSEVEYKD